MGANAGTAVPVYASGEVLTAARLNLTNCGVPVFSGTATRDAAFGGSGEKVLAEGQLAYLEDADVVQYYTGAAWATVGPTTSGVVQVKSTAKTDTFTTTSTSFVDITGLSVSITPTSASNKILILAQVTIGFPNGAAFGHLRLSGGNATTYVGDAASSRIQAVFGGGIFNANLQEASLAPSLMYLDSPATTSATTYVVQIRTGATGTVYVNRSAQDANDANHARGASSITVMEVAP